MVFSLDAQEIAAFEERGVVRLTGRIPMERIDRSRQIVIDALARNDIKRDGNMWQFGDLHATSPKTAQLNARLMRSTKVADLASESLLDAVAELVGAPVTQWMRPRLLLTLPNVESWVVPHEQWHVDLGRVKNQGVPGIQIFIILDSVVPRGGGTVVVAGSHQLTKDAVVLPGPSKLRKALAKRYDYFRDLTSATYQNREEFLCPKEIANVTLQVVELYGSPGDAYVVDLRALHANAPNASDQPRIMSTQVFLREDVARELGGGRPPME